MPESYSLEGMHRNLFPGCLETSSGRWKRGSGGRYGKAGLRDGDGIGKVHRKRRNPLPGREKDAEGEPANTGRSRETETPDRRFVAENPQSRKDSSAFRPFRKGSLRRKRSFQAKPPGEIPRRGVFSFPGRNPEIVRDYLALTTLAACGPLGPWVMSNSTRSPSWRDLKPSARMALKWTNTSGPFSWLMNPNPFASLNHFTLPVATSAS